MAVEHYEIKANHHAIVLLDIEDPVRNQARFETIVKIVRSLGGVPFTKHSFLISRNIDGIVDSLKSQLNESLGSNDEVLIIADSAAGMVGTALVCAKTGEGISVKPASRI